MAMKGYLPIVFALGLLLVAPVVTSDDVTVTATVAGYVSATFNFNTVNFGTLDPGTSDNPAPNQDTGVYNVTVDANADYKIEVSGTEFTGQGSGVTFPPENLKIDTADSPTGLNLTEAASVPTSPGTQLVDIHPADVTTNYYGFWLTIPSGQLADTYTSTVTITYSLSS